MYRKKTLRLVASQLMASKGESNYIRLSKKAREHLELSGERIFLGKGPLQVELKAKEAYLEDVKRLARMVRQGRISQEEAAAVAFVTKSMQAKISRKPGNNPWITQGIGNITVGCDPEFGLIGEDGLLKRADRLLPGSKKAQFGADGPGAEVRPAPSVSHIKVVENIGSIFKKAPERALQKRWVGGASYVDKNRTYWFGGHVHLGRPSRLEASQAKPTYQWIARALDALVALPLVSFDTPNPATRRNGCPHGYGKANMWQEDLPSSSIRTDYPEQDRFEYRVLSGLWLTHPSLARMVLGVSKCVAESVYEKLSELDFEVKKLPITSDLSKEPYRSLGLESYPQVVRAINTANPKNLNTEMISDWQKTLRNLEHYEAYAPEVEALIEIVKISPEQVIPQLSLDIKENWEKRPPVLKKTSATLTKALEAISE